jgi:hypothetical protein
MQATYRLTRVVKRADGLKGGLPLGRESVAPEHGGVHHRLSWRHWYGLFESSHPGRARLLTPGVRRVTELFAG